MDYSGFYAVVRRIPKGRVATYGQVARLAGLPAHARHVGYALAALEEDKVPWHRVINAQGKISLRGLPHFAERQRERLEAEGVLFDAQNRVLLKRFQWKKNDSIKRWKSSG